MGNHFKKPDSNSSRCKGLFCTMPFEFAQIEAEGWFFICCPMMMRYPSGNLHDGTFMELWNSDMSQKIRNGILEESFEYCLLDVCVYFQSGLLKKRDEVDDPYFRKIIDNKITYLEKGPVTIDMSYDKSCNLACSSCRTDKIVSSNTEFLEAEDLHNKVFAPEVRNVKRYILSGSGDPFASKLFLSFLKTFDCDSSPDTRIQLSTNGISLDKEMWNSICNRAIDWIDVSIDAATPETYKLNRGGNFAKLLDNLAFLGNLNKNKNIAVFSLHFVVQQNNFREMRRFAEIGFNNNCTVINFKQLVNRGTYTEDDYKMRAIQFPEHPEHIQFLEILKDSIFNNKRVFLNDLSHLKSSDS